MIAPVFLLLDRRTDALPQVGIGDNAKGPRLLVGAAGCRSRDLDGAIARGGLRLQILIEIAIAVMEND